MGRVTDYTGTNQFGVDIDHASRQMFPAFDGSSMIAILPVGSFSIFSLIVFLSGSSSNQLH